MMKGSRSFWLVVVTVSLGILLGSGFVRAEETGWEEFMKEQVGRGPIAAKTVGDTGPKDFLGHSLSGFTQIGPGTFSEFVRRLLESSDGESVSYWERLEAHMKSVLKAAIADAEDDWDLQVDIEKPSLRHGSIRID
ncbi:MAG: hypothetical protein AAF591_16115 [Verrucomicrobiota bacterium]